MDGYPDNVGGQQFTVYVEDWNEPGTGVDKFWFNVLGRQFSLDLNGDNQVTAANELVSINGNIVVPHTPSSGGDDDNDETIGTPPTLESVSPDRGPVDGQETLQLQVLDLPMLAKSALAPK